MTKRDIIATLIFVTLLMGFIDFIRFHPAFKAERIEMEEEVVDDYDYSEIMEYIEVKNEAPVVNSVELEERSSSSVFLKIPSFYFEDYTFDVYIIIPQGRRSLVAQSIVWEEGNSYHFLRFDDIVNTELGVYFIKENDISFESVTIEHGKCAIVFNTMLKIDHITYF